MSDKATSVVLVLFGMLLWTLVGALGIIDLSGTFFKVCIGVHLVSLLTVILCSTK